MQKLKLKTIAEDPVDFFTDPNPNLLNQNNWNLWKFGYFFSVIFSLFDFNLYKTEKRTKTMFLQVHNIHINVTDRHSNKQCDKVVNRHSWACKPYHGIEPKRDWTRTGLNPHGIEPARDWTHTELNPQGIEPALKKLTENWKIMIFF